MSGCICIYFYFVFCICILYVYLVQWRWYKCSCVTGWLCGHYAQLHVISGFTQLYTVCISSVSLHCEPLSPVTRHIFPIASFTRTIIMVMIQIPVLHLDILRMCVETSWRTLTWALITKAFHFRENWRIVNSKFKVAPFHNFLHPFGEIKP